MKALTRCRDRVSDSIGHRFALIRRRFDDLLRKRGTERVAAPSLREERQALIDSSSAFTADERQEVLDRAAEYPGIEEALDEGDAVFAEYVEGLKASELRSHSRSLGHIRR